MKRAVAVRIDRVHPADCTCKAHAAAARRPLSYGAVALLWTVIGLTGAIAALVIADWAAGGPGVQVMFGFAARIP